MTNPRDLAKLATVRICAQFIKEGDTYDSSPPETKLWYNVMRQALWDLALPVSTQRNGTDKNRVYRDSAKAFFQTNLGRMGDFVDPEWVRDTLDALGLDYS